MKTTVALFFALVILLPHSANAETLTITGGRADLTGRCWVANIFWRPWLLRFQTREPGVFGLIGAFGVEPFVLFYGI